MLLEATPPCHIYLFELPLAGWLFSKPFNFLFLLEATSPPHIVFYCHLLVDCFLKIPSTLHNKTSRSVNDSPMTSTETLFLYAASGCHLAPPRCDWWQKIIFIHIAFLLFLMLPGGLLTLIFLNCHSQVQCFLKIHNQTSRSVDNFPMTSICTRWMQVVAKDYFHTHCHVLTLPGGLLTLIFLIATHRLIVF